MAENFQNFQTSKSGEKDIILTNHSIFSPPEKLETFPPQLDDNLLLKQNLAQRNRSDEILVRDAN